MKQLHWYICRTCRTTAVTAARATEPSKGSWRERPICCLMCHCYMRFMYSLPVETLEDAALHARGLVFNPGTSQERTA